jgi:hypothetical protein
MLSGIWLLTDAHVPDQNLVALQMGTIDNHTNLIVPRGRTAVTNNHTCCVGFWFIRLRTCYDTGSGKRC